MTDLEAVTDWVSGYVRAWHSNDPEEIGELFAQGGTTRRRTTSRGGGGRGGDS